MTNLSSSSRSGARRAEEAPPVDRRLPIALFAAAALLVVALVATAVVVLTDGPRAGQAAPVDPTGCSAMTVPVRYQINPTTRTGLFTSTAGAATAATEAGWTTDQGIVFRVASSPAAGLVEVHQLRLGGGDQLWTTDANEVLQARQSWGYVDQGVVAYVSEVPAPCTVQVRRFQAGGAHRYATTTREQDALSADGWAAEGSFYAARPGDVTQTPRTAPSPAQPPSSSPPSSPPTPLPPTPGTVIDADFDDVRPGPVTPASFVRAVGSNNRDDQAYESMSYVTGDDGTGRFVRTHLAAHEILGANDSPGDGNVLVVPLADETQDSACISYDVRFSAGFEVSAGGKLPGLLGVAPGTSPATPTGGGSTAHGWSGRVMWIGPKLSQAVRDSGLPDVAVTYLYHPGQTGTFGDDISWGQGLVDGTWHSVRQCYTLNTIGEADGRLQAWIDDVPVLDRSDLVYRTDPEVHITHLDWSVFRGGDTEDWAADTGGDIDLDNLLVTLG